MVGNIFSIRNNDGSAWSWNEGFCDPSESCFIGTAGGGVGSIQPFPGRVVGVSGLTADVDVVDFAALNRLTRVFNVIARFGHFVWRE